jgi:putative transcriptional regulator
MTKAPTPKAKIRRKASRKPFHYTASGLSNVWLMNGFEIAETSNGRGVRIKDADGLHTALAHAIAVSRQPMSPADLRFLRKHMGLSQNGLARLLGCSDQSVARWEKGKGDIVPSAERLVRLVALEFLGEDPDVRNALNGLAEMDEADHGERRLRRWGETWKQAA